MDKTRIAVETLRIPTYVEAPLEEMPMFMENRMHQLTSGNIYPRRIWLNINHSRREERDYVAVHMENDFLDVLILPEIGGRIFAARDKNSGYDFLYRQHVIKPALIGSLGNWISGGMEFNWPYHHRPSGFLPCDYSIEECADGSAICWLSEHEPTVRMKGMVGIVLRPDCAYLETRVKLSNRTPVKHSFLWWENAAVPVNEQYQIFFPHDVTYVNYHYLDSRISYPIAGDNVFYDIDMTEPRDISWHRNSRDSASYFACASKYDFFGGYDHGKDCGVVHIADHHISPGKKLFTWAYNQISRAWERALTDTDGAYAELMAGSYSDNQPDFSWLDAYETKEFSQYWYPIAHIGTPDYANLHCAVALDADALRIQAASRLGRCSIIARAAGGAEFFRTTAELDPARPLEFAWQRPGGPMEIEVRSEEGAVLVRYCEETPDELKMPPVRDPMPHANEMAGADELYLAGVHVEQYRDPAVQPDAYWLEALKRNPDHAPSLLAMARYCLNMLRPQEALRYSEHALRVLTRFNERPESGEPYYLRALAHEALGEADAAYDDYYRASWSADCVAKAMGRIACLDLARGDAAEAARHARRALRHDAQHPLAPVVLMLAEPQHAAEIAQKVLADDPLHLPVRYLSGAQDFYAALRSEPAQSVLDVAFDLCGMGQYSRAAELLRGLVEARPEEGKAMIHYALAWLNARAGGDPAPELALAETAALGGAYPSRQEEAGILRFAVQQGSARAKLLLGCLLYAKRQYAEGGALFEAYTRERPDDYIGWRCLAVACYSHLHREGEALGYMRRALDLSDSPQLLYETVSLMDRLGCEPAEKIALLTSRPLGLDSLYAELAKAYDQNGEPERALDVLRKHDFLPCEGGELSVTEPYMFACYQLGLRRLAAGEYAEAKASFEEGMALPDNLSSGIKNTCRYAPYKLGIAECLEKLGQQGEAEALLREILNIKREHFTLSICPELPFWQALAARRLGLAQRAQNLMTAAKREWNAELARVDDGYFRITSAFISFVDDPARLRRAHYLYLTALVDLYDGKPEEAGRKLRESHALDSENLLCGYLAHRLCG